PTPEAAEDEEPTIASLVEDLDEWSGQTVTVRGEVGRTVGRNAFTLTEEGDRVGVVSRRGLRRALEEGENVEITGTVDEFDREEIEDELGIELSDDAAEELEGIPVIIAESGRRIQQ
ncbi:MAG: hypothetical protein M3220_13150, partial [Chloroflexota bacterium]|nr:hypothetical protein [Chloroflexota bacterium]